MLLEQALFQLAQGAGILQIPGSELQSLLQARQRAHQPNGGRSSRCGNLAGLRDSRADNIGASLAAVAEGAERKICAQAGGSDLGPSHRCQNAGGDTENLAAVMQVLYQFTDEGAELRKKLFGARRKFALQKLQRARQ